MLALVVSKFLFIAISVIWKLQTRAGANALSSLATYALALPVFIGIGLWQYDLADVNTELRYIGYLLVWVIPVFLYSLAMIFLYQYQSLTEQDVYKFATGTVIGLGIDLFILDVTFSWFTILTIALFFGSGWLLTKNRTALETHFSLPLIIAVVFGISLFEALDFFLYKQGMLIQDNVLLHIVIAQVLLISCFTIAGFPALVRHLRSGAIRPWQLVVIPALFVPAVLLEGLAIYQLPIVLMVTSSIISIVILTGIDVVNRELVLTTESKLAILGVIGGILIQQLGTLVT